MEKEVIIICLVYIERLIINSGFNLLPINWRRIAFVALILASKVILFKNKIINLLLIYYFKTIFKISLKKKIKIWDDESYENDNFAKAFPKYST